MMTETAPKIKKQEPLVAVKRSKTGLGLFATQPIKKDELIIEYVGEIVSSEEGTRRAERTMYIFAVDERYDIDGSMRSNIARYMNHSCRPNCEAENDRGRIFIRARRNIAEGEELTYDYGREYFEDFIKERGCKCVKCSESRV